MENIHVGGCTTVHPPTSVDNFAFKEFKPYQAERIVAGCTISLPYSGPNSTDSSLTGRIGPEEDGAFHKTARKQNRISLFVLQGFGLLVSLVLIIAAKDYTSAHPGLATLLMFAFSVTYLFIAAVSAQAHLLYGTMLLGAIGYFLVWYAAGLPTASFPLLSLPLVLTLLSVGHYLRRRLSGDYASFHSAVFNAMHITVTVFALWALVQVFSLIRQPGFLRFTAMYTYLGYAGVYAYHGISRGRAVHTYIFTLFLTVAALLLGIAALSFDYSWAAVLAASALVIMPGLQYHRLKTLRWSQHSFYCFALVLVTALGLSFLRLSYILLDLSLTSLLLWLAYRWFGKAVGDIRRATTAERLVPRFFFLGAILASMPVIPFVLIRIHGVNADLPALISGIVFCMIARNRREERGGPRILYTLGAGFFVASALIGLCRNMPGPSDVLSLVVSLVLVGSTGLIYSRLFRLVNRRFAEFVGLSSVFPAFFSWYVPMLYGRPGLGLIGALAALGLTIALRVVLNEKSFLAAVGPAVSGAIVAGLILTSRSWPICATAAAISALLILRVDRTRSCRLFDTP